MYLCCFKINSTECYNVSKNCVYRQRVDVSLLDPYPEAIAVIEIFEIIDTKVHVSLLVQFRVNLPTLLNNILID